MRAPKMRIAVPTYAGQMATVAIPRKAPVAVAVAAAVAAAVVAAVAAAAAVATHAPLMARAAPWTGIVAATSALPMDSAAVYPAASLAGPGPIVAPKRAKTTSANR